jgi:hypothetical protein
LPILNCPGLNSDLTLPDVHWLMHKSIKSSPHNFSGRIFLENMEVVDKLKHTVVFEH